MEPVQVGDFVKHKTISWMNNGKPFRVIKIENDKAICEYTGQNSIQYFHEFDIEQLIIVSAPIK
jgi:hypothetical protein